MKAKIKVGALVSGGGSNLQAIIDAVEREEIDAEIVFVGTDSPGAFGLERAKSHNIPAFAVDYREIIHQFKQDPRKATLPGDLNYNDVIAKQSLFRGDADPARVDTFIKTRAIGEAGLLQNMDRYSFDLLVLAGFMRNLTPYFIDRVNADRMNPRIMNIHPALLPAFAGTDGYGDTFRYGCKIAGCTVHFIDYGEDSGPIIAQRAFAIGDDDTLDAVKKKGLDLEWRVYPQCIQMFAQKRLQVVKKTIELPGGKTGERKIVEIRPAKK